MASMSAQSRMFSRWRTCGERIQFFRRQEGMVRVSSNISYFVPGPTDDSEAGQNPTDRARRQIYETASRECGVAGNAGRDPPDGKRQQQSQRHEP